MNGTHDRTFRRRVLAGSAALTVAGGGILLMGLGGGQSASAAPAAAAAAPAPKVWVCKYVGKPGVNERLKGGKNPIAVSSNATVGTWFNDAQGRSYVIAVFVKGQPGPSASDCPAASGPTSTVTNTVTNTASNTVTNSVTNTVTVTSTVSQGSLPEATTSAAGGGAGAGGAAPVPGGVEAGKHTVSGTSAALGGALMTAGAGGIAFAARRPRKQHAS